MCVELSTFFLNFPFQYISVLDGLSKCFICISLKMILCIMIASPSRFIYISTYFLIFVFSMISLVHVLLL